MRRGFFNNMAIDVLKEYIPGIKEHGISTDATVALSGTETHTGTVNLTGQVNIGATAKSMPTIGATVTVIDAQNGTPSIAHLLGGVIRHNSKTGAGTLTTPTGAEISGGVAGVAVGTTFDCIYINYGNQTVTITAGASGVTVTGTAAVAATKNALIRFVCTAADTWIAYPIVSA
jgi:hypothetical protein